MGLLSLPTLILVYLPCATCTALATCTTTLLRSLAGLGGAFDVPKAKCPPDRGSSDCVTGDPAPILRSAPISFSPKTVHAHARPEDSLHRNLCHPSLAVPRAIPLRNIPNCSTPPLTPDDGSDSSVGSSKSLNLNARHYGAVQDALDFLMSVFPRDGLSALSFAKAISISSPRMDSSFDGVVLELPGKPKTLYVDGKSAETVSLRESIVALLDLADESLHCSALIIVLDKTLPKLGELLHSLMYVGGIIVTKPPFPVDSSFVLVGLEI